MCSKSEDKRTALLSGAHRHAGIPQIAFRLIRGDRVAYSLTPRVFDLFAQGPFLSSLAKSKMGFVTGDNDRFLRRWWEVDIRRIGFGYRSNEEAAASGLKWFPLNKGGGFRRWFGNLEYVINWQHGAKDLLDSFRARGWRPYISCLDYCFRESLSWSDVGSRTIPKSFRLYDAGFVYNNVGHSATGFPEVSREYLAGYCNTPIVGTIADAINPTVHFGLLDFGSIPIIKEVPDAMRRTVERNVRHLVAQARADWNAYEVAWDFDSNPLVRIARHSSRSLRECWQAWLAECKEAVAATRAREEENNRLFIGASGLEGDIDPNVPDHQITLHGNPAYRYKGASGRFLRDTLAELVSFAIGCMMGRYSLDHPGLVYAKSAGRDFDPASYETFPADDDGILPITALQYFDDDVSARIEEFLVAVWGRKGLEDNLAFLASGLAKGKTADSRTALRSYLQRRFYNIHLKQYRNRPIYWLLSSGPKCVFQCLIYLHRYHAGTLARVRTLYVIPLQGMITTQLRRLKDELGGARLAGQRSKLFKEHAELTSQAAELRDFDERLRRLADRRIHLDLDDGVKVNYQKLGDLVAKAGKVYKPKRAK